MYETRRMVRIKEIRTLFCDLHYLFRKFSFLFLSLSLYLDNNLYFIDLRLIVFVIFTFRFSRMYMKRRVREMKCEKYKSKVIL